MTPIKVGDRVSHKYAGPGVVTEIIGKLGNSLRVKYDNGQTGGGWTDDFKLIQSAPPSGGDQRG